ncbi:hypothetical protein CWO89_11510 [Bradyrhizobium sp. Leo170]|nr:hypothetical protein CWO89_11510 [Bradyrhizobium sp. Leo170]
MVGRSPPGFDSAGFVCGSGGDDCTGGVACATSSDWRAAISTSEAVEITSPPTNRADAIRRSFLYLRCLSVVISFYPRHCPRSQRSRRGLVPLAGRLESCRLTACSL